MLDGEIVALDARGRPLRFQALQGRMHAESEATLARHAATTTTAFVAFDLLADRDRPLTSLPFSERRKALEARVPARRTAIVRRGESVRCGSAAAKKLFERARTEGWEGVLLKRVDAPYVAGKRTADWRKVKLEREQEFVIGGYTAPTQGAARDHFGALLVGYYDARGALRYAGKVGTGYTVPMLALLAPQARAAAAHDVAVRRRAARGRREHDVGEAGARGAGALQRDDRGGASCGSRASSACATTRRRATCASSPRRAPPAPSRTGCAVPREPYERPVPQPITTPDGAPRTAYVDYLLRFVLDRSTGADTGITGRLDALERTLVALTRPWRADAPLAPARELRASSETLDTLLAWLERGEQPDAPRRRAARRVCLRRRDRPQRPRGVGAHPPRVVIQRTVADQSDGRGVRKGRRPDCRLRTLHEHRRTSMRRLVMFALAGTLAACSVDSTGPNGSVAGNYTLRRINGSRCPYTFSSGLRLTSDQLTLHSDGTYQDVSRYDDGSSSSTRATTRATTARSRSTRRGETRTRARSAVTC